MTAIVVLRHPQTTWNLAGRYQGRLDAPLSETGREQSRQMADALRFVRFRAVYSSPLSRARDLAVLLAERASCPLITDARLTEIALGPWEGLHRAEIEARFPVLFRRWYENPRDVRFPGGESAEEVQTRATAVMSTITRSYPGDSVLVVTHAVVIQTMIAASLCLPLAQLHHVPVNNGSVTTFRGDAGMPNLVTMNGLELLYRNSACAVTAATGHEGRASV